VTKLSKKVLLPMVALGLAVATGMMVVSNVSADEADSSFPPVIQALVDKFNLNQDEVATVLEEVRATHQAEMHQQHQAQLDEAVTSGQHRDELEAWAEANDVDLSGLLPRMGEGHHGPRMGNGRGFKDR